MTDDCPRCEGKLRASAPATLGHIDAVCESCGYDIRIFAVGRPDGDFDMLMLWTCCCGTTLTLSPGEFLVCCREAGLVN